MTSHPGEAAMKALVAALIGVMVGIMVAWFDGPQWAAFGFGVTVYFIVVHA